MASCSRCKLTGCVACACDVALAQCGARTGSRGRLTIIGQVLNGPIASLNLGPLCRTTYDKVIAEYKIKTLASADTRGAARNTADKETAAV